MNAIEFSKEYKTQIAIGALGLGAITFTWLAFNGIILPPAGIKRYPPNSPEAKELLTYAAVKAGLPEEWGSNSDIHWIMGKESQGGWVGIPNYTFGSRKTNRNKWQGVWDEVRSFDGNKGTTSSNATGLGQLLASNAKMYYPDGLKGIGDPVNEAVGYLRYIYDRYGTPEMARSVYGKWVDDFVHPVTGKTGHKKFKEGY